MTIRFIQQWNGYAAGDVATLSNEAALIAGGLALDINTANGISLGGVIDAAAPRTASFTLQATQLNQRVPVTTAGIAVTADNALPAGYHALIDNTSAGSITVLGASVAANKLVGVFHRGGGDWLLLGN